MFLGRVRTGPLNKLHLQSPVGGHGAAAGAAVAPSPRECPAAPFYCAAVRLSERQAAGHRLSLCNDAYRAMPLPLLLPLPDFPLQMRQAVGRSRWPPSPRDGALCAMPMLPCLYCHARGGPGWAAPSRHACCHPWELPGWAPFLGSLAGQLLGSLAQPGWGGPCPQLMQLVQSARLVGWHAMAGYCGSRTSFP